MKLKFVAAMALALACSVTTASPASDEAEAYTITEIRSKTCRQIYELGALKASQGEVTPTDAYREFLECQGKLTKEAKSTYKKVIAKAKGSDAKKAVKDYQVALLSLIDGLDPKESESKYQYSQRISSLESSLSAAKQRMHIELD